MKNMLIKSIASALLFFCLTAETPIPSSSPAPLSENPLPPLTQQEEGIVLFTPPANWHLADPKQLPKHVRVMVIGKGMTHFPPSMNLSWEPYKGSLKDYLKIVKNLNAAKGAQWKDLGTIRTQAGPASLSQVENKTQWGVVKLMHTILVKNGNVYILTASAPKNEFSIYYQDFFNAMRSLRVVRNSYEMLNPSERTQLKTAVSQLEAQWQNLLNQLYAQNPSLNLSELRSKTFESQEFQHTYWNPFKEMLQQKYGHLGAEWMQFFLQQLEQKLFNINPIPLNEISHP